MNLDWNKIKKEYPKAFNVLVKDHATIEAWGEIDNPKIWGVHIEEPHWVIRHLYDFFDSKEIYVNVTVKNPTVTEFMIRGPKDLGGFGYENRTIAEIYAFTNAFRLLEMQLTGEDIPAPMIKEVYSKKDVIKLLSEFADKTDNLYRPYTTNNILGNELLFEFIQKLEK